MTTILEAINRAAAQAIDLGGRPTVFTAGPRLTAILARARAMRALGLPHPWDTATRHENPIAAMHVRRKEQHGSPKERPPE